MRGALQRTVQFDIGHLLLDGDRRPRVRAFPVSSSATAAVAVTTVRLGQRDEALRELLAQLALANLAALALASLVGYRLARAALLPVERYRSRAEQIAAGATGLRLDVPIAVDDEVTRLGHTLNRMLSAAERAAEQQRRFLADASHELRTPLALLSAEVELALRRPRSADQHEQTLTEIATDIRRLQALAEQLLDLERAASAGSGSGTADAAAAGQGARQRLGGSLRGVELEVPPGLTVAVGAQLLDQVLGNLIDNAVNHGSGVVRITGRPSGAYAVLAVHDDGAGPPAEFVPYATERFRRADQARSTPGSGLGLALVHSLVIAAGGELRLCSGGAHHRYPPLLDDGPACRHPDSGTTAAVVLSAAPGGGDEQRRSAR